MVQARDEVSPRLLRPGDRVRLQLGSRLLEGVVVEDRGALGLDGRQIVRVSVGAEETLTFEVRAEDLEVTQAA